MTVGAETCRETTRTEETTMTEPVSPIPEGYHSVTPYLVCKGAAEAIEFYTAAFGAVEVMRMSDGERVGHAELTIGDSRVMLADEHPEMGHLGPHAVGGCPMSILLYVEDVDATVARAVAAGATLERPVANQFYGDRTGGIVDPFGYRWYVATHVEDVSPEEMQRRSEAAATSA
jgi:PhnB protein